MKLKFIGTGSGLTSLKRYHSSILIKTKTNKLLVDAGDGIDRALLNTGESYTEIDSIILSHYHPDHFSGITSLLVQMKILNRIKPLKIFTHTKLIDALNFYIFSCNLFIALFDFKIEIIGFEFNKDLKIDNSLFCVPKQNAHVQNNFKLNINFPFISSSFLFTGENKNIIFTADIGTKNDLYLFEETKSADCFIVDSTHIELDEIGSAVKNIEPKAVYLTHINDADESSIIEWIRKQNIKNNVYHLAEDNFTLEL